MTDPWQEARARAEAICGAPLSADRRREMGRRAIGLLDLTTLRATDTAQDVVALCVRAIAPAATGPGAHVAAVCVHSSLVGIAAEALDASAVRPCCVAGAFPHGQAPLAAKVAEVGAALEAGAQEVDVVINRGLVLEERIGDVAREIGAMRAVMGEHPGAILKVILETCEIPAADTLRAVARAVIAELADGDFLKTSTGKGAAGATPEGAVVMLEAIADAARHGRRIGFKAAGGVSAVDDALMYMRLAEGIAGREWADPARLRIGASGASAGGLLDRLLEL